VEEAMKNKGFASALMLSALFLLAVTSAFATLTVYPAPSGTAQNTDYTVQVREEGGTWQDLFEYNGITLVGNTSFVYFDADFSSRVEVKVIKNSGTPGTVKIRPLSYGIQYVKSGNTVSFFLDRPRKVSVEFDGDIYHNLQLFANPLEVNPPHQGDPGVTYYGPGTYNAGTISLSSNQTLYIAGGAVVRGHITASNANNLRIMGRGILDGQNGSSGNMIRINNGSNIAIEGIIITNASHSWCVYPISSDNVTITNIKEVSSLIWTDGIDPQSCQNVTIDDVFIRNGDDCISIKATGSESNNNITIKNSIFWSDKAHGILIGPEGNGLYTSSITFVNNDILETNIDIEYYQGAMAINNSDSVTMQDITFKDVRVENFTSSCLVYFQITSYGSSLGKVVRNILFKNITYNGANTNTNKIFGADSSHYIDGVTFDNLRINGNLILSAAAGNFQIGPYANNVVFTGGNDTTPPGISAVSASGITSTAATINWTTDESATSQVEYGLTTSYGSSTALNSSLVTSHSASISGLTANTLYHYRVKSADASANTATGTDNTFTTTTTPPTDTTPPVISAVTAGSISQNSAVVTWTTNESATSQVEYGLTTSYGSSTALNSSLATSHGESLSGLAAGTLYHYRVKSADASANMATGTDRTFTTAPSGTTDTTAPAITAVAASGITSNSAVITWTTDEGATSKVEYGLTTSYGGSTTLTTSLTTSHSVKLSNLAAGTKYHYRAESRDAAGNTADSADLSLETAADGQISCKAYPNPFIMQQDANMTFSISGTGGGAVDIYTISGKPVKSIPIAAGTTDANWYLSNDAGNGIKSGIYIYVIKDNAGNKKTGKIVITN
jgi:hypothetical protein